jgi:hypothetical protein
MVGTTAALLSSAEEPETASDGHIDRVSVKASERLTALALAGANDIFKAPETGP